MTGTGFVKASGLGAIRGERRLYSGLGLEVQSGEAILLRGANGAGKTTFLRQLAGLSEVQAGKVCRKVDHHWIGHANGLKAHETPRAHLRHWACVWGSRADIDAVISRMALKRPADVPVPMLSAGQKRRTALGRLLLAERPLWLLDEPFSGLDREGEALLAEMITAHRGSGGAVIAALHGDTPIEGGREVSL